jgi:hypothetical protein
MPWSGIKRKFIFALYFLRPMGILVLEPNNTMTTKNYFEFSQNNSGGGWQIDHDAGIGVKVFVQASSPAEANDKAEAIGIYFNGVSSGRDCECCGSRWSECWESDTGVEEAPKASKVSKGDVAFVHHDDGTIEKVVGTWDWMADLKKGGW